MIHFFSRPAGGGGGKKAVDDYGVGVDPAQDYKERMAQSISRTKSRIFELAGCNEWEWFFTGTLNPEWHNAVNLEGFRKRLSQFIRDCRKKYNTPCRYLLIPEQHKSGAWHVHGLLGGFPECCFRQFQRSEKLPVRILKMIDKGQDVRDWSDYSGKFGFTTVTPIRSQARCTSYITKYVTKSAYNVAIAGGGHMFYASQGLSGRVCTYEGRSLPRDLYGVKYDFSNDYVEIADIYSLPPSLRGEVIK